MRNSRVYIEENSIGLVYDGKKGCSHVHSIVDEGKGLYKLLYSIYVFGTVTEVNYIGFIKYDQLKYRKNSKGDMFIKMPMINKVSQIKISSAQVDEALEFINKRSK